MLFLLSLYITCHLESAILIFQNLKLFFLLHFLLSRAHEVHFKSLPRVTKHAISIVDVVLLRTSQDSFMLASVERSLLDIAIIQCFLLIVLESNLVDTRLVTEYMRFCLKVKHVFVLFRLS